MEVKGIRTDIPIKTTEHRKYSSLKALVDGGQWTLLLLKWMWLKKETAFVPLLYLFVFVPVPPVVIQNDDWTWEDAWHYLYEEKAFDNIVISPGPGSPTCANDIGDFALPFFCCLFLLNIILKC